MRKNKGELGYITGQKKWHALMLLVYILIGIGIFFLGYFLNHGNKANVFTVLAILTVLPATKRIVAIVVLFPYHSEKKERWDEIKAFLGEHATLLTDYVFTSSDNVMHLSFVVVDRGNVIGVMDDKKQRIDTTGSYFRKSVCNFGPNYNVHLVKSVDELKKMYSEIEAREGAEAQEEAVLNLIRSLGV